jgi:hypothetical protein
VNRLRGTLASETSSTLRPMRPIKGGLGVQLQSLSKRPAADLLPNRIYKPKGKGSRPEGSAASERGAKARQGISPGDQHIVTKVTDQSECCRCARQPKLISASTPKRKSVGTLSWCASLLFRMRRTQPSSMRSGRVTEVRRSRRLKLIVSPHEWQRGLSVGGSIQTGCKKQQRL